jgi:hypothetical protein
MLVHVTDGPNDYSVIHGDFIRIGGDFSEIGIKDETGAIVPANDAKSAPRMYYADGTIDEFLYWRNSDFMTQATQQFRFGRYYRPDDGDNSDGLFTSADVSVPRTGRVIPPPSAMAEPSTGQTGTGLMTPLPFPNERKRRLFAVAWTVYAEEYKTGVESDAAATPRLEPFFYDYQYLASGNPQQALTITSTPDMNSYSYPTAAQMYVLVGPVAGPRTFGPYHNEGWSAIRDSHENSVIPTVIGNPVELTDTEIVRFRVKLRVGNLDPLNTVLLATPVVDDVTLYFDYGTVTYLSYVEVRN